MSRGWAWMGCVAMAVAVGAGAFGAHGLREAVSARMLDVWETAARYNAYHGLALIALDVVGRGIAPRTLRVVGLLFLAGLVLFSGSLYALVLTDQRWLGAITPIGGTAWIGAWCVLAVQLWRGESD